MAKLRAPLLSLSASGNIGKAIQFYRNARKHLARQTGKPSAPPTEAQQNHHAQFATMAESWRTTQTITPFGPAWSLYANTWLAPHTGYTAFMRMYFNVLADGSLYTEFYDQSFFTIQSNRIGLSIYTTDNPNAVQIRIGPDPGDLYTQKSASFTAPHRWYALFTGLAPDTEYFFQAHVTPTDPYALNYTGIFTQATTP